MGQMRPMDCMFCARSRGRSAPGSGRGSTCNGLLQLNEANPSRGAETVLQLHKNGFVITTEAHRGVVSTLPRMSTAPPPPSKAADAEMKALRHVIARPAGRIGIVEAQWSERRIPDHARADRGAELPGVADRHLRRRQRREIGLAAPAGCWCSLRAPFRNRCRGTMLAARVFIYVFNLSLLLSLARRGSDDVWHRVREQSSSIPMMGVIPFR